MNDCSEARKMKMRTEECSTEVPMEQRAQAPESAAYQSAAEHLHDEMAYAGELISLVIEPEQTSTEMVRAIRERIDCRLAATRNISMPIVDAAVPWSLRSSVARGHRSLSRRASAASISADRAR